ncbi:MAG: pseudaminic acid synthase [Atopobiaceae bacterium]|nr:pseudaminic acid synthase [Atopobiaceae bacterium]
MFHMFEKIRGNGVYVIAEMSANHGGSIDVALEIVRQSAKAGADCLKIQTYTADSITIDCDTEDFRIHGGLWDGYKLYDLYTDAGTPYEWQESIRKECEKCGIDFLSTPFDSEAVDFLESIGCEAYKIASFELVDIPLIEYAASKGKPMVISCGMSTVDEIQDAVDACLRVGNDQLVLLKCCSEYPANWKDMHIANIPDMMLRFGVPVGLSDHSEGSIAAVVAVSMGASVIEKHVKIEDIVSADSEFSMPMNQFAEMVSSVRDAKTIAGTVQYGPTVGEEGNLKFRRSLFAVKDIMVGEAITVDNVRSIRPSGGLKTKYLSSILGKKAKINIPFGTPMSLEMVE